MYNMGKKNEMRGLAKSFRYAFRGICYCVKNERNMRIHLSMVVLLSYFSYFYGLNRLEYIALFLCFGLVIGAEAFNTAIEALVNLESPSYHHFARIAKDVAAGAVAVTAFASAVVGILLYFQPDRLDAAIRRLLMNPAAGIGLLVLVLLALLFIFYGPRIMGEKRPPKETINHL